MWVMASEITKNSTILWQIFLSNNKASIQVRRYWRFARDSRQRSLHTFETGPVRHNAPPCYHVSLLRNVTGWPVNMINISCVIWKLHNSYAMSINQESWYIMCLFGTALQTLMHVWGFCILLQAGVGKKELCLSINYAAFCACLFHRSIFGTVLQKDAKHP